MRLCLAIVGFLGLVRMATAAEPVSYERDIRPLLHQKCASCHGVLKQQSGLRLDAGQLIRKGSENGPAVVPGKSAESELIRRVTAADGSARMPPDGEGEHLSAVQVDLLKRWIDEGANFPADEKIPEDPAQHWSYKPVARPKIPAVKNAGWVRNPIDAFIAAEQEKRGLTPSPEAAREVWLRRVTLDLIGLPPTREELNAFLSDHSADAYEKVVDDLLQRPEHGERWGRHWMDVWRYSDWYGSRGINEIRYSQRHIWRWRDWIVESLNADKPYHEMIVEMLAGDELAPTDPNVLRATGFLGRNWYKFDRNVWMFETIEQTSQAFLGLTMKCARCHDHKYDPITQDDYYRFRAFFEPHDVRTDAAADDLTTEKDATLGQVLKVGVSRVFDKQPDVKTFVFQRGDNRYPDEKRPMSPGVPASLGNASVNPVAVQLPVDAFYPMLSEAATAGLIQQANAAVALADEQIAKAKLAVHEAGKKVASLEARIAGGEVAENGQPKIAFQDNFAQARPDDWKVVSGDWKWENQRLTMATPTSFATVVTTRNHPRDFRARVRYRTLQPGQYRSVGFSFDYVDTGNSQDVYTSANDTAPTIQAFHRKDGQQTYPQAGIVKTPLKVGEEAIVEVTAQGQQLTILLNGEKKLDYVMPLARREGKFSLWAHNGAAEFLEVEIRELVASLDSLKRDRSNAEFAVRLAEKKRTTAEFEVAAVRARIEAERAKYGNQPAERVQQAARAASQAEKQVLLSKAEEELLTAENARQILQETLTVPPEAKEPPPALVEAEKKIATVRQQVMAATAARDNPDGKYAPIGDVYPRESTGRRLALARWIADARNPRTARIAVNHIWLRHFGQALVPSVSNFGLNGDAPSHPELLDWLSAEFTGIEASPGADGAQAAASTAWRMKRLHRLMVLSATYRQSSETAARDAEGSAAVSNPRATDPNNRFLWRMNSRRMEAEVVRDSVLASAGLLDRTFGGPEIPEAQGHAVLRRSLYFRLTPNEKMKFLETFDAADPNGCYRRKESVVPQQALALMNSELALDSARSLAGKLSERAGAADDAAARTAFIVAAYETVLSRKPTSAEQAACERFLQTNAALVQTAGQPTFAAGAVGVKRMPSPQPVQRARENLVHVLYSHNDFVTIR